MSHEFLAKEIFIMIATFIDDALTFKNLALVCKKSALACKQLSAQKKDEFSKKVVIKRLRMTTICSYLPNKWKHGSYSQWYNNGITRKKGTYDTGYMTGYWELKYYTGKMSMSGLFVKGQKTGTWLYYDTDGNMKTKKHY
jgi:antitoxin component YwqK of YwqJK toxin-antitoxin module